MLPVEFPRKSPLGCIDNLLNAQENACSDARHIDGFIVAYHERYEVMPDAVFSFGKKRDGVILPSTGASSHTGTDVPVPHSGVYTSDLPNLAVATD